MRSPSSLATRDVRLEGTTGKVAAPPGNEDSPVRLATFFDALSMPNDCAKAEADEAPCCLAFEKAGWNGRDVIKVGLVGTGSLPVRSLVDGFTGTARGLSDPITLRCFSGYGGIFPVVVPLAARIPKVVSLPAVIFRFCDEAVFVDRGPTVLLAVCRQRPSVFEGEPTTSNESSTKIADEPTVCKQLS